MRVNKWTFPNIYNTREKNSSFCLDELRISKNGGLTMGGGVLISLKFLRI